MTCTPKQADMFHEPKAATERDARVVDAPRRQTGARAAHERHHLSQAHRRDLRIIRHLDSLPLRPEPAWRTTFGIARCDPLRQHGAFFMPRLRRRAP